VTINSLAKFLGLIGYQISLEKVLACGFRYHHHHHYRYICMEEKRVTQKQLKKVHNMNAETNKEEKGN